MHKNEKLPQQYSTPDLSMVGNAIDSALPCLDYDHKKRNEVSEKSFSYPFGSFPLSKDLLKIPIDNSVNDKFHIFETTDLSAKSISFEQTQSKTVKTNPYEETFNAICSRQIQMEEVNSPYQKLEDESCVTLADLNASYPKTIPVIRFGEPEVLASLASLFTSNAAEFIDDQTINFETNRVLY